MRKRLVVLMGTLIFAVGLGAPVPAHAEGVWNRVVPAARVSASPDRWVPERTQRMRLVGPCYVTTICFYDTPTSSAPFRNIEDVDAPRNYCFNLNPYTSYIVNTSQFYWVVSDHADCSGTRGNILPYSEGAMSSFWNNNIRGVYRTSSTY